MPTNKNASFRYRVINNCLRNTGRKWKLEDLIDKISEELEEHFGINKGISKRQIQEDINIMRSLSPRGFDAPIVCEGGYYSYSDPGYSIDNNPLNEDDFEMLNEALSVFKQYSSLPFFSDLQKIIAKVEGAINFGQYSSETLIEFENNECVAGTEFLSEIYQSILIKQVLEIKYQPFSSDKSSALILHPYLLKEYRNRWFLLGLNEQLKAISILALDRIKSIEQINVPYSENSLWNKKDYFKNIIGVTLPENKKIEAVKIVLSPSIAPYIKTKPIHHTQRIIKENTLGTTIQLDIIPNYELVSILLGYGEQVKVLKPKTLVMVMQLRLQEATDNYTKKS